MPNPRAVNIPEGRTFYTHFNDQVSRAANVLAQIKQIRGGSFWNDLTPAAKNAIQRSARIELTNVVRQLQNLLSNIDDLEGQDLSES